MVEFTYRQPVRMRIAADQVLREIDRLPHLLLRVTVHGSAFVERALEPFATLDDGRRTTSALLCEVVDGDPGLRVYFPTDVTLTGRLTVGYGADPVAVIPLGRLKVPIVRLDPKRIVGKFHRVTTRSLGRLRG